MLDINNTEYFSNITDKDISDEITKYKARQNRTRKSKHDRLSDELKSVKQLYRRLNIGDISKAQADEALNMEDIIENYNLGGDINSEPTESEQIGREEMYQGGIFWEDSVMTDGLAENDDHYG